MRFLALLLALLAFPLDATAQRGVNPRFGIGFEAMGVPPGQDIVPEGLGLGLRARVAFPLNRDLSIAIGSGFDGFVLKGQDDASYVANPQLSFILTLPRHGRSARYLLGGAGGFIPLGGSSFDDPDGGPALHLGIGWAFPLNETSLYVELDPSLVIGTNETTVVVPARVGVIF